MYMIEGHSFACVCVDVVIHKSMHMNIHVCMCLVYWCYYNCKRNRLLLQAIFGKHKYNLPKTHYSRSYPLILRSKALEAFFFIYVYMCIHLFSKNKEKENQNPYEEKVFNLLQITFVNKEYFPTSLRFFLNLMLTVTIPHALISTRPNGHSLLVLL